MNSLNYEFFDEFKALDNLCRDIYGESVDKKLGVTLYLEDMERKANRGAAQISGWSSDYQKLKNARNIRNELAHSRNSFSSSICNQEDIDFVHDFRMRILNQTDPIAQLRKQSARSFASAAPHTASYHQSTTRPSTKYRAPQRQSVGCLGIVAAFVAVAIACIIVILT